MWFKQPHVNAKMCCNLRLLWDHKVAWLMEVTETVYWSYIHQGRNNEQFTSYSIYIDNFCLYNNDCGRIFICVRSHIRYLIYVFFYLPIDPIR